MGLLYSFKWVMPAAVVLQRAAELEAAVALKGCPLLPTIEAQWSHGRYIHQLSFAVGDSLDAFVTSSMWTAASVEQQYDYIEDLAASILLGLFCNQGRVSAATADPVC